MRYRLVLFDFDGTLADTLLSTIQIFNDLSVRHGFRPIQDPDDFRRLDLMSLARQQAVPLLKLPLLMREYRAAQLASGRVPALFPGLAAVLEQIHARGFRMGVLSSSAREPIVDCLRESGVAALFEHIEGYSRLLGKARGIRSLQKKNALDPRDLLYVGDEVRDIDAARGADSDIAAVDWGFNTAELLRSHNPTFLAGSPEELLKWISGSDGS